MRRLGKVLGWLLLMLVGVAGGLWIFGPYEPVDLEAEFEPRKFGEGVQVYFESIESGFDDITPGVEKRVVWQPDAYERRTPVSVLYIHGFSATSQEIRPVPDAVAEALGANLVYTRLQGHGRGAEPMGEATVAGWMQDVAEGLAAARAVGDRVVVLATSTGATLAVAAAMDPEMSQDVAAMIFVSPNFGINDRLAFLLTWPGARYWVPLVVGDTRSFEPTRQAQATFWTTSYPVTALMPMAALVAKVVGLDVSQISIPTLFRFSDDDQVVRPDLTRRVADRWGGPVQIQPVRMGPGDDPASHVIAGDIMSPGQTDATIADMLAWLAAQGIE
ncbi:alpha/beta hydrolase [Phaeobacter marinintestinus]|uniref:alpha/beta hydrolase n=1 Tax=Falsiphaeobacter marinintestinus TaxID=1492905 RepID=UPI0011B71F2E|nr:alpha/beta fold hydrolase [Phaeobacter marinintestinus]